MTLPLRIIPVIQVDGKKHVKTTQFKNPVYIGSPTNTAKILYDMGAYELIVIDITGTLNLGALRSIARNVFVPISYDPEHVCNKTIYQRDS
jgi:imidazole glycerol-phosphate synthase subunit HisF